MTNKQIHRMSFLNQAKSSIFWTFLESFFTKVFTLIVTLILTRILLPEDFGLIGLITIFIAIGKVLIEGGMGASLIRDETAEEIDFSTIFIGNTLLSIVLYGVLFSIAPFVSVFFEREILVDLLRIYGLIFIISAFSIVQDNILMKELSFKKLTIIKLPGIIIGATVSILAALNDYGVWSLVLMTLSTQFIQTISLWYSSNWKPSFKFDYIIFKKHFDFGYKLMLSSLLNTAFNEIYAVIIGKRFTIEMLGYYTQARTLNLQPVTFINTIISKATYPLLSSIKTNDRQVSKVYQMILRVIFFLITPLMMLLAVIAEPLFLFLFSDKWVNAIPFFQILAFSSLLIPIHSFNINVFKVFGRTDLFLKLEVIKRVLTILVVFSTWYLHVYGLLFGMVLLSYLSLFINTYYSGDLINYKTLAQLKDMAPVFIISLLSASISYGVLSELGSLHYIIQIGLVSILFGGCYLGLCVVLKNNAYKDFMRLLLQMMKKDKRSI